MYLGQATSVLLLVIAAPGAVSLKVHDKADPCTCLKWADAYKSPYGGKCGFTGRETSTLPGTYKATKEQVLEVVGQQFCQQFFEVLDDNSCVLFGYNSEKYNAGESWCYVSSECTNLGPLGEVAHHVNGNLSVKVCTDTDQRLVAKTPPELEQLAIKMNVDFGMLAKWAYPKGGELAFPEWQNEMAMSSEFPTLWDSEDGTPPFEIYAAGGGEAWRLEKSDHMKTNWMGQPLIGTYFALTSIPAS
jgi:hypothetical protein